MLSIAVTEITGPNRLLDDEMVMIEAAVVDIVPSTTKSILEYLSKLLPLQMFGVRIGSVFIYTATSTYTTLALEFKV